MTEIPLANPILFDQSYANEKIDFITKTSETMVKLFQNLYSVKYPPVEKIEQLSKNYDDVMREIADYYVYLEKTATHPEESYLTHWLKKSYSHDYYEEIEYFLKKKEGFASRGLTN